MAYYAPPPPPRPERGATSAFSHSRYAQETTGYGYVTPPTPPYPSNTSPGYYPPSSSKLRSATPANYPYYPSASPSSPAFPPTSPGGGGPSAAPKTRRRSVSFSTPVVAPDLPSDLRKKEMLYRHVTIGPDTSGASQPKSKPRRFSKTYTDGLDCQYYKEDYPRVFDDESSSGSQDDDFVYGYYDKERLSQRFDRSASGRVAAGLRRSGTEKISSLSSSSRTRTRSGSMSEGVKMPLSSSSLHVPRAPRPPAPQRATPPPPASNRSGGSDRSRRSDRATYGGTTVGRDYDYDYEYDDRNYDYNNNKNYEYVTHSETRRGREREHTITEKKQEKSWMNINGNRIVVDSKGVKINGQRYENPPGGKGVFNVGGIKIRVDGGVISLV